MLLGKKQLSN